jgi:hypothetical protein
MLLITPGTEHRQLKVTHYVLKTAFKFSRQERKKLKDILLCVVTKQSYIQILL